eukprot:maker-scaffold208_size258758-snap-gene-0.24 protein:Tk04193 transcript:maker-scaffold208_size258758-snap-gene-0.24-mRNA-1 annotation:"utp--glucose-1-phosphate uridylyltransferase"
MSSSTDPTTPDPLTSVQTSMLVAPMSDGHHQKKMYGHNRSPSREFKELTKRDAQILLNKELERLLKTGGVPAAQAEVFDKEFDGFKDVFGKFLTAEHQAIKWDKIEKLHEGAESLMPVAKDIRTESDIDAWYPPGHGDFYQSFYNSHLLNELISQGREFVFMSNIDNMGATVDLSILNLCLKESHEFIMEVTDKTRADVKGGTLIQYEGKLRLLEVAQVSKNHMEDFKSVKKFNVFNTNNLWISLPAIKRIVEAKMLDMEVIVNPKVLDGGVNVLQLETAVGAAMKCFENGMGLNVPRSRFLPVKKSSDLLLIMSNLYSLKNGNLVMSPERMFQSTPLVKLGDAHFKKVSDFLNRFASIPDIIELDHLTVSGNVNFGKGVVIKGTVIIIANHGDQIDIPSGAILENKIVSGNLRILDH